jgi:RNA polymerase sigma-70 factor (ECF subfamily)
MSSEIDRLLVQQIRLGDERAWQQLIARYEGRLLAFVERRIRDRAASEDAVQETFVGFLNSLPNFDDRRDLQSWLFTIAAYKVTDHLRRVGRRPPHVSEGSDELGQQLIEDRPAASSLVRSDERRQLEAVAIARFLGDMIRAWQERGDFQKVKVLELLLVKGWPNHKVADALGLDQQTVANWRFAALRKLGEYVRSSGLPGDVFPELRDTTD